MASVRKRSWTHKGETKWKWVVEYTDQGGGRRRRTCASKNEAEKMKRVIEKSGSIIPFASLTVAGASELYIRVRERRWRDGEIVAAVHKRDKHLAEIVATTIGRVKLSDLNPWTVQQWVEKLRGPLNKPVSPLRVRGAVDFLRNAITEAQRLGYVHRNVVKDVPPRLPLVKSSAIEVPTKEEVQRILSHCTGDLGLMVRIAVFTGMRAGEICALKWRNVDFVNHQILVRHSLEAGTRRIKEPKTKAGLRDVPIPPDLEQDLLEHRKARRLIDKEALVFHGRGGVPLSWEKVAKDWAPLLVKAGMTGIAGRPAYRFHSLRHFAASCLIEAGLPPKRIQYLIGHSSITETFDRYGRLFPDAGAARTAVGLIENSLRAHTAEV